MLEIKVTTREDYTKLGNAFWAMQKVMAMLELFGSGARYREPLLELYSIMNDALKTIDKDDLENE